MSNFQEWCVKVLPFINAAASGETIQARELINVDGGWGEVDSVPMCFPVTAFDFDNYDYRIKPPTIMIGDIEVPEPIRNDVDVSFGVRYFVPLLLGGGAMERIWAGKENERLLVSNGLCHETRWAATTHAKALIALTTKKDASHE